MKNLKTFVAAALAASLFAGAAASAALQAQGDDGSSRRVLNVKPRIVSKEREIKLKDVASNYQILSDEERELEISEAPTKNDESISLIDLAYMLQRHPQLMDVRLVGPRTITLQKVSDSSAFEKAKSDIVAQIKSMAPWKDWEIDVLLSASDEVIITKACPFSKVELLPSENKNMIGSVALNVAFVNDSGRQTSKGQLNPTILRKVAVAVLSSNARQGTIIAESTLKKVPMWLGPENKDYVTDTSECIGKEIARSMSAGEILKTNDILNPVCAKRGDMVWVECRSGALTVKLAATALEGGRLGDTIKVVNQPTQKSFSVQLVGEKQAFYTMGG